MSALSTPAEWDQFLKTFAVSLRADNWPGAAAASEEDLLAAEKRFKAKLPPSYRAFLGCSNGWRNASRAVPVLRPVEKIRWFKREHRDWVQAYIDPMQNAEPILPAEQDYFNYSQEDSVNFDVKHLSHTLCISEVGDSAVLLLNPMVVWPDGEWEVWFFANWLPGATRYRSFADWMRQELAGLTDETFEHSIVPGELPTVYLDGPGKAKRGVRPREENYTLDEVLNTLTSKERSHRIKAVHQLCQIGDTPAIAALLKLLKEDYDVRVRREAADALGRLRANEAIKPLIALASEKSRVASAAVHSLANFNDEQSAQCLLKLIEEDGCHAAAAAYALAKRRDSRGVPPLLRMLVSNGQRDYHIGNIAGRLIAGFQEPGFLALEPLMNDPDVEIRRRAISGMTDLALVARDKSLKLRARGLLQRSVQTETDARLHEWLAGSVEMFSKKRSDGENASSGM